MRKCCFILLQCIMISSTVSLLVGFCFTGTQQKANSLCTQSHSVKILYLSGVDKLSKELHGNCSYFGIFDSWNYVFFTKFKSLPKFSQNENNFLKMANNFLKMANNFLKMANYSSIGKIFSFWNNCPDFCQCWYVQMIALYGARYVLFCVRHILRSTVCALTLCRT